MDKERWEIREDLLDLARDGGHPVTGPKLARWHRAGLISRPKQRSLGRGHGTQSVYPPGTGEQLLRLCEVHFGDGVKRLPHVGWQLWWEGYDVSFDLVRSFLSYIASSVDEQLKDLLDPETKTISGEKWEEFVEGSRTARLDKPVRGMRGRVGRDRMPTLMSIILEVPLGLYETFQVGTVQGAKEDDSDSRLAEQAFGLDQGAKGKGSEGGTSLAKDLEITLGVGSRLFREHSLSEVLDAAEDEDLRASRDQVRLMLTSLRMIGALAEEMPGSEAVALRDLSRDLRDLEPPDQALLVLSWTMWRLWGPPGTGQMMDSHYEELQQAIDQTRRLGWNITDT